MVSCNSSRSHTAINSSTLATMRCCSARGGSGIVRPLSSVAFTFFSGVTLRFRVDGIVHQLAPGARQELEHFAARIVEFDRGESFGLARYRLTEGDYYFRLADQGWTLQRKPYTAPSLVMD